MERKYAGITASISEFRKNPAAVLREANNRPVVVVSRNRPAFYVVEPRLFEACMDELASAGLHPSVRRRMADNSPVVALDAPDLYSKPQMCEACGGAGWILMPVGTTDCLPDETNE